MCQSGAVAQAKQGITFIKILGHYYKSTDLQKLY
jgi:peptidoglycan hydrolase-like amidase